MEPKNVLIALVFLLLISFFSFNFEEITGFQVKNLAPLVTVTPNEVKAGQPIQIKIKINEACIDPELEFLPVNGLRKDSRIFKPTEDDCADQNYRSCKGAKYCKGDLVNDEMIMTYYTLPSWKVSPGQYAVRIRYIEKVGQPKRLTPHIDRLFTITS
tara:strand:- start:159 stop:629 length:471 start_codon:yes stop_codon:yes gene_type:complete